jgi:hypothetical protein
MRLAAVGVGYLAVTALLFTTAPATAADPTASDDEAWETPKRSAKPVLSALELGLTAGLSIPFGTAIGAGPLPDQNGQTVDMPAQDLSEIFSLGLPLGAELGYLRGHWYAGVSGAYARLFPKSGTGICGVGGGCSSHSVEVGAWVAYHGSPEGRADPWVALGLGLEWATLSSPGLPAEIDTSLDGYQAVQARAGLAYKRGVLFGVGPFVGLSVGQYFHTSTVNGVLGSNSSSDIANKGIHEWLTLGVRFSFDVVFVSKPLPKGGAGLDTDPPPPSRPPPPIHGR